MSARDRALGAVRRVREVRERDSRLGLQRALADQRELQRRVAELEAVVDHHRSGLAGQQLDLATFAARQLSLQAQDVLVRETRAASAAAGLVRESADGHWRADKTRLSAAETLLEARAAERRREVARAVAKDLDETGTQSWSRQTREEAGR